MKGMMRSCRGWWFFGAFAAALLLVITVAIAVASEGGGGGHQVDTGKQLKDFGWRVLDFSLLFGLIWWALKKADVKGMLAERRNGIAKSLQEAEEARRTAEQKLAEYKEKLATASRELEQMQAAIRQEGAAEKDRIIAEALVTAAKIKDDARLTADQEVLKARAELRHEAARLAVELAQQQLQEKITKDDQNRLVGEYLDKVVNAQ